MGADATEPSDSPAFERRAETPPRAPTRGPTSTRAPVVAVGSAEFEAIRLRRARHVGPIAKVFVQKAGTEARTADELCQKLATHVRAAADREAFLRAARAVF